jgi:hypothetical protein
MPEGDEITEKECEKCKKSLESRMEDTEKILCNLVKPEDGVLSKMHEKINTRPTWVVFWSITSILFMLIFGAYSYNYLASEKNADRIDNMKTNLATKQDVQTLKDDISDRLDDIKKMIDNRR